MATQKISGRKRLVLAGGSLLVVAGLATAAAFTDFAALNLGSGATDSGIGSNNTFDIKVVGTDTDGTPVPGTWQDAAVEGGVDIKLAGADSLTPGNSASIDIPFQNASPVLGADLRAGLKEVPGKTSSPELFNALRYTVELAGQTLATDVTFAEVSSLSLGKLAAGDQRSLNVKVSLPDQGSAAANNALQGQTAHIQLRFDAEPINP